MVFHTNKNWHCLWFLSKNKWELHAILQANVHTLLSSKPNCKEINKIRIFTNIKQLFVAEMEKKEQRKKGLYFLLFLLMQAIQHFAQTNVYIKCWCCAIYYTDTLLVFAILYVGKKKQQKIEETKR